jgi:hypothetical protein
MSSPVGSATPRVPRKRILFILGGACVGLVAGGSIGVIAHNLPLAIGPGLVIGAALGGLASLVAR